MREGRNPCIMSILICMVMQKLLVVDRMLVDFGTTFAKTEINKL